jgi:hypothetical protein
MLEIKITYYPAELDVPAIFAARAGNIQGVGATFGEAVAELERKLAGLFPRSMPKGNLFAAEAD